MRSERTRHRPAHAFVERDDGRIVDERLFADRIVSYLYSSVRESAPTLFRAATSARMSRVLGWVNYDAPFGPRLLGSQRFLARCGVDLEECVDPPRALTTPRAVFERRIRYWDGRPQPERPDVVVSPADSRATVGSLNADSALFIKGKFFALDELLGTPADARRFVGGEVALFRLTPDKYHYTHTPVSGRVEQHYPISGAHHACNPSTPLELATPLSRNARTVTVFDTDVEGGTGVGVVAMVEVVALMIGRIDQRYSERRYEDPRPLRPGDFAVRGAPKALFRPGSSSVVLLFEPGRVRFADDLERNAARFDVPSRLSLAAGRPLVETDVRVRSPLAFRTERR